MTENLSRKTGEFQSAETGMHADSRENSMHGFARNPGRAAIFDASLMWLGLAPIILALDAVLITRALQQPVTFTNGVVLLALHALLSLGCAQAIFLSLPDACRHPRRTILGLLFVLAFFIPQVGCFGLRLVLLAVQLWPETDEQGWFGEVTPPEFTLQGDHVAVRFGVGGVRARLSDRDASAENRLEALLAIKSMPQRLSSPLLRTLLNDPEEDLRLLAYGMLDSEEKNINERINQALDEYRRATEPKTDISRRLAFLYWELVYQNLVQGDVKLYALQEAGRFAREVLDVTPSDAGVWVLLGKIRGSSGEWEAAHDALMQGRSLGFPATRLIPYLAEHAFRQRRFDEVKTLLQSMETIAVGDVMQPIFDFWTKDENRHPRH
ncbi:hypothetical protein SAMN05660284_02322 [Formivibrio citricus]|uniref:Uncharacterized protein n=2 Tax=Formivibrio citricus TaxID=83765 RepID=A0A1I5C3H3_9NEIS|nr:hypothetical protein SAMN05660284_02322 [Formivibrio citricus]